MKKQSRPLGRFCFVEMVMIKVYGLSQDELNKLRLVAVEKTGKKSVSFLARSLLLEQISTEIECKTTEVKDLEGKQEKTRLEMKLPANVANYLEKSSLVKHMSANMVALGIIIEHMDKEPVISDYEIQALYQSNYQLLRIGRNLNQIARQMNVGESVSLTLEHIQELTTFIREHTEYVGQVLLNNRQRLEGE
ncbi:MAG: plasmid mobilization relaxosome protein MobC [Neisseria sp.]|nr:plasmid mobilization relaxosome protein MobC [Neisseria sp.]